MFKSAERKKSQGFTLAEVLIVVAVIGILLAVAIPNVISYSRSLKLTELDDSARSIFMAAQNRLTAMKCAGEDLSALSTVEVNEKPDPGVGTGRFLAVTSEQADSLASLVPGGSIESQLHDNHYVVEIDAKTGAVYAVWYWEKEDFDYQSESYDAVKPARSDRLKAGRMVGYYGGSFIDRPTIGQTPMPSAQAINAEELSLNITVSGDGFTGTPPSIKATITLINGSVECVIVSDASLKYDSFENVFTGRVALDTLDDSKYTLANNANSFESGDMGKSFKDWVYDTMTFSRLIIPGANFDIEVKVTAVDTSGSADPVYYLPQYLYWANVNSLFAGVEEDPVTGEPVTAHIAYGRHLQNLDSDTSGVTNTITAAEQTRSIDFNDSTSVTGVYSWADTYGSRKFKPIESTSLTSYNGHEYEIRNLNIQKNTSGRLGLFGLLYNLNDTIKFEKIILVNTKSEEGIVGALVGGLGMNGYIDDCHVYLDEIGADGKLLDPSPRLKGSYVGGLVGMAYADLTMTNCSAATVISSAGNAGGLVSNVAGACEISKSYAACNLTGAYVGGLVGLGTGGVTIQNSYAAGTADVVDDAGVARKVAGLVNWAEGTVGALPPELTNSYAAVRYGKSVTDALASGSLTNVYGACEVEAGVTVSHLYYVKQAGIKYEGNSGTGVSMSELKGMIGGTTFTSADGWYEPSATVNPRGLTYPYNLLNDGLADPYPYPMLAGDITAVGASLPMPHYGDWLENSYATSFYWEREGTDYKFYLVMSDGATQYIADNLCTNHHLTANMGQDVDEWGYGLIGIDAAALSTELSASTATTRSTVIGELTDLLEGTTTPDPWVGDTPVEPLQDILALLGNADNVILLEGSKRDNFQTIKTDVGYIEMNLGFAAAIDVTEDSGTAPDETSTAMGKAGAPYQIRTVRQLDNIPDSSESCFEQTHDIVFGTTSTYSSGTTFKGDFNGGSYRIIDIEKPVFDLLDGSANIHDVILYAPTGDKTISEMGGIANRSSGTDVTIDNTIVAGFKITGETSGGLVGEVDGGKLTISNSEANNDLKGNANVGGLVGLVGTGGILEISDSYAGGSITGTPSSAGGLVGLGTNVTYSNVYSYVDMSDPAVTAGTVYGIGGGTVAAGGTARYWKGGIPSGESVKDDGTTGVDAVSLADLTISPTTTQHTYIPGANMAEGLTDQNNAATPTPYPFTPVVNVPATVYEETGADIPVHYGDWPDEPASAQSLCYYEGYPLTGGSIDYRLWGYIDPTDTTPVNNLQSGGTPGSGSIYAVDDGYCILVKDGESAPTSVTVDGDTANSLVCTLTEITGATYTDGTTTYHLYKINGLVAKPATGGGTGLDVTQYYHEIDLGGGTKYWFNPFFACEVQTTTPADMKKPQAKQDTNIFDPDLAETDNFKEKVIIRTARQLANLADQTGDQYKTSNNDAQLRKYEQLLDIDYDKYTGPLDAAGNRTFITGTENKSQQPAALSEKSGGTPVIGSYNGHGFIIRNLYIKDGATKEGTGLFGDTKGTLSNIRLVNVSVESTANSNKNFTGALAGNIEGDSVSILNCGVYVDNDNKPKSADPTKSAYDLFTIKGVDRGVGGLVGKINASSGNLEVKDCFAAVKVEGDNERVGGLIGHLSADNVDSTITNCYSGGHTVSGDYNKNDVNVTGKGQVGGLIGCIVGHSTRTQTVTLSNVNYSTCSVSGDGYVGLLIGNQTGKAEIKVDTVDSITYAVGTTFNSTGTVATPRTESYLTKPTVITKGSDFKTHPYDIPTLEGKDYPYETNLNEHYGDWVMPKFQVSGYIYWELEGSEYHYSVTAWDREKGGTDWTRLTIDPTLCNEYDTTGISNYGYGWFYSGDFDGSNPTMTGASGGTEDTSAKGALESSLKTALETALPGVDLGTVTVTAYSYNSTMPVGQAQTWNINIDGTSPAAVTLNPDFADTITTGGTVATPYKVRTIYQLQHINHTAYLDKTFEQGHDLDGAGVTDYVPIGNGTTDGFTGSYDGKGYRIRNLDISVAGEDACAGLFGKASGSANFERIIMWGNNNTISASDSSGTFFKNSRARVGGIVAEIPSGSVTISNCVVTGYQLEASATGAGGAYSNNVYVGGIVANLNGTVANCEAVVDIRNNNGTAYIGGLVGEIGEDSTGGVANSYVGGTLTTSDTHCVGGVVGESNGKSIENCYSYVTGATYAINAHRLGLLGRENNESRSSCAYFGNAFANNRDNSAHQCADVTELTDWLNSNTTFQNAEHVYNGSGEVTGATFNGAVVQVPTEPDGVPVYVHYGDWPT